MICSLLSSNWCRVKKLASIGQLTAGIAHELNNPINFVASSAQSLRRDFEDLNQVVNELKAMDPTDPELVPRMIEVKEMLRETRH